MHDNIIFNILVWLPAEKAYEFRLVCKSWYNIIKSPSFKRAHLRNSKHGLIFCNSRNFASRIHPDKIMVREFSEKSRTIWSSYNGLVLLDQFVEKAQKSLFLANPVTQEVMKLPSPSYFYSKSCDSAMGLTYISATNKHVLVHFFVKSDSSKPLFGCETLTVGDNKWKLVFLKHRKFRLCTTRMITINNVAHAVVWDEYEDFSYLVSWDMIEEKFHKTTITSEPVGVLYLIFEIGGVLCLCSRWCLEIRRLKDFRTGDWELPGTIDAGISFDAYSVEATLENGKIVIGKYLDRIGRKRSGYFAYDIELKETTYLEFSPDSSFILGSLLSHVDSLVSLRDS